MYSFDGEVHDLEADSAFQNPEAMRERTHLLCRQGLEHTTATRHTPRPCVTESMVPKVCPSASALKALPGTWIMEDFMLVRGREAGIPGCQEPAEWIGWMLRRWPLDFNLCIGGERCDRSSREGRPLGLQTGRIHHTLIKLSRGNTHTPHFTLQTVPRGLPGCIWDV